MTTMPPEAPPTPPPSDGPRVSRDDVRDLDRLRRTSGPDRYIAGVSGGVARHLDLDPTIVRVLFVVLAFFGGAGLLLYGALWLLLPEERTEHAIIGLDSRSLTVAIVAVLGLAAVLFIGDAWGGYGFPWPLTVAGIVVAVVLLTRDRREGRHSPAMAAYDPAAPETGVYGAPGAHGLDQTVGTRPSRAPGARAVPDLPRPAVSPRPRDPRRRGPILFWFTLATIALGGGVLGIADVSGVDVPGGAYPALALAIVGVMLLVGAFYGRAGGLILLGLLITPALVVATAIDRYDGEIRTERPLLAAAVPDSYTMEAGELEVDLTELADPEALDGRTITIDGGIGRIEVRVPPDVDVNVNASVDGPGNVSVFGRNDDGLESRVELRQDVTNEVATISIDATLGLGEIVVLGDEPFPPLPLLPQGDNR